MHGEGKLENFLATEDRDEHRWVILKLRFQFFSDYIDRWLQE
jgi:hypothetical protein